MVIPGMLVSAAANLRLLVISLSNTFGWIFAFIMLADCLEGFIRCLMEQMI